MKLGDMNLYEIGNEIQLVGCIYQGKGKSFLCFFPEDKNDLPHETLDMGQPEWEAFIRQTDILETVVEEKDEKGHPIKAILRKSTRQIEQGVSWRVYRRDGYACRYCGKNDLPLTVDHLVLWESSGPSIEVNLVSACKKCNRTRGSMEYTQWLSSLYYEKVSAGISDETKRLNAELVKTLPSIPLRKNTRSR